MKSQVVRLATKGITDWESFHSVFAKALGFPDFYGRNMNAWNDCMTYLDDAGTGMTTVTVSPGELFHLEIADAADFQKRLPEVFQAFIKSAAFVNWRRVEQGERPVLALVLL
jgi:hypothetical protein